MSNQSLMEEIALALTLRSVAGRFGEDQQRRERAALERLRREDPGTWEAVERLWTENNNQRRRKP